MKKAIEITVCDICGTEDTKDDFYHIRIKGKFKDICPSCTKMIGGNFCISKNEIYSAIIKAKNDAIDDYHLYSQTISYQGIDKESYMIGISTMCDKLKNLID